MTSATAGPPQPDIGAAGEVKASTMDQSDARTETPIGRKNQPIRVLTFSSGGLDTAMQLGVTHALLVMRAEAPDVVLGVSAGAVNAVALAEILQAGPPGQSAASTDGAALEPLEPRVARFRQILEDFQNCPHDLLDAMLPDAYQIDAQKPVKTLRLPVHAELERRWRDDSLASRAGLINFYNELLLLRASIGTITRAVRRVLGVIAARESLPKMWRAVQAMELFRLWMLIGTVLHRLAPLVWPIGRTAVAWRPWTASIRRERGVTAARLIFRSGLWTRTRAVLVNGLSLLLLTAFWVMWSGGLLALFVLVVRLTLRGFRGMGLDIGSPHSLLVKLGDSVWKWAKNPSMNSSINADLIAALGAVLLTVFTVAVIYGLVVKLKFGGRFLPTVGQAMGTMVSFFLLLAWWTLVLLVLSMLVAYVLGQVPRGAVATLPWTAWRARQVDPLYVAGGAALLATLLVITLIVRRRRFLLNLLARYGLADSLLHPHPLRQFFVRVFDPGYYGPVPMDAAVDAALARSDAPYPESDAHTKKYLDDYAKGSPPIRVALSVADVSTGELSVISGGVSTVDGLMAATAAAPILPPVRSNGRLYIDAANVANQTTEALMNYLRFRVHPEATAIHVYSVASLPLSRGALDAPPTPAQRGDYATASAERTELVKVIGRAMQIQRFRDAHLDQKLLNVLSRVLPPGNVQVKSGDDTFLRAWAYPIEPDENLHTAKRFFEAPDALTRRRVVAETVADGCRAALQTMLSHQIRATARTTEDQVQVGKDGTRATWCGKVIADHHNRDTDHPETRTFPGSAPPLTEGEPRTPGLVEVCRNCALYRDVDEAKLERRLVVLERKTTPADWYPRDRQTDEHASLSPAARQAMEDPGALWADPSKQEASESWRLARQTWGRTWPHPRRGMPGTERATVSFLFSGGVFRGVYQMGVLNALNLLGLRPDVIAGASVGSITAAMIARVFREPNDSERVARIARLAATYLALDRLILTDRFADFVRGFTVRAASTRFSLNQADRVFRAFDKPVPVEFDRELRAVAAGLERLFYISPFELKELVEAMRRRKFSKSLGLLADYLQEWLARMGVGNQVLGAEPLSLLIAEHVLEGLPGYDIEQPGTIPFDVFTEDGIYFLATATNLSRGRLEVLGDPSCDRSHAQKPVLLDGLLASSAFPGVFRPRWSWEIMPAAETAEQYIDGGVTDNLPLDAVAEFLNRAAMADVVSARPVDGTVPHLLLCASLERRLAILNEAEEHALRFNWPALWHRAGQLGYNKKIDLYAKIQRSIRQVVGERVSPKARWNPLDLEVVAIKPEWLCSTFAFHPMLNFRRRRQAQSIAHGCASTLIELARPIPDDRANRWKSAWGIDESRLPDADVASRPDPYVPLQVGPDECWFKPGVTCPFSRTGLARAGLFDATASGVQSIYTLCGRPDTHRATT
jgi:predicted acylesterase/phospholipase RssA